MRVFLSWSGELSQKVAVVLRDWLPSVIQSIEPYVSSEDIDKGARWSSEISKELEASDFGVLCITSTNTEAPWLNFEAGALSKSIEASRVVPFLFRIERSQLPQGPLVQFQSVLCSKEDVRRLVFSLNAASGERGLEEGRLDGVFDVWWPKLAELLDGIEEMPSPGPGTSRSEHDVMNEMLELVRAQQQLLNNPEALLPVEYVRAVVATVNGRRVEPETISPVALSHLETAWNELIDAIAADGPSRAVIECLRDLELPVSYFVREHGGRRRQVRSADSLMRNEDGPLS